MKKLISSTLFLLLSFLIWNCDRPTDIGEEMVRNEILDVTYIDTLSLQLSTVFYDSLPTSNTLRHLVGYYEDAQIGNLHAKAFFNLSVDSLGGLPEEDAEFLFAEFECVYDGYFYYDTIPSMGLKLYPIKKEWELDDDGLLFNNSDVAYDDQETIGEISIQPRPSRLQTFSIPIQSSYAEDIFRFILSEENDFLDEFEERFPGLVLDVDTTFSECFIGFSPRSQLKIHYRESGEDKELVFPTDELRFNQISNHRNASSLASLSTIQEDIPSEETNQQAFLQNGIGLAIKVEIESLDRVREIINANFIVEASLILRPVKGTYGNLTPLPFNIEVFETDELNRVVRPVVNVSSLTIDEEFNEDTEYRLIITDFIREKINDISKEEDALLIQGVNRDFNSTVDRIILGNQENEFRTSIELLILDYTIDNN